MDRKSKIFFIILGLLIAGSVAVTYWRIMVKKDYVIEAQTDCDPYTDKCFVWECDPESTVEGEACTGDPENDIWYFQVARRNAAKIPLCDPETDETCDPWTCGENEKDCSVEFCTEENMEGQYASACNDPIVYTEENPVEEEEAVECEEGDTECEAAAEEDAACEEGDETCASEDSAEESGDTSAADSEESADEEAPAADNATPAQLPIAKEGAKPALKN